MLGFADQSLGVFDKCTQEMDHDGNPVIVFNLGKGRPCHDQVPRHACMCGCGALVALV